MRHRAATAQTTAGRRTMGAAAVKGITALAVAAGLAAAGAQAARAEGDIATAPAPASGSGVTGAGAGAGAGAVLEPITPGSFTRSYQQSALKLRSRLLNGSGKPIVGAEIEIIQRAKASQAGKVIGHAATGAGGQFTAEVPQGPSRTIDLAYRDPTTGSYMAQTEVVENVTAGVKLTVTPRRTRPTGRITLAGHVLGELPRKGVVVEVLVYYHGSWEPIRTPRTSAEGRFRIAYRFDHAYGRFPFALRVRSGQEGFPYRTGVSEGVEVVARGR